MNVTRLGFIGFGEAAFNISQGLKEEGLSGIVAYDKYWDAAPRGELIRKRAAEAGVELLKTPAELTGRVDFIVSAVSADMAVPLAREYGPLLRPSQYFVDINAASPMTKEEAGAIVDGAGASYCDVAVMGPVPNYRHKVPILAGGKGAPAFRDTFTRYGMDIAYVGEKAGKASALKMFRSIFMKGFVALLLESLIAGHRYGAENEVLDSIIETLTEGESMKKMITGVVARGVIHSERREHEMAEVVATLESLKMDHIMSGATKEKLRWCTNMGFREYFHGVPPKELHEVLTAFDELSRKGA